MQNLRTVLIFSLSYFLLGSAKAQSDSMISISEITNKMAAAAKPLNTLTFKSEMYFKGMEEDLYDKRDFKIAIKEDEGNLLYGIDWKIEERMHEGIATMMMLPQGFFVIFNDGVEKGMYQRNLRERIETGNYFETMRSCFVLEDIINPFITSQSNEIILKDSSNYFILYRKTSATSSRTIWLYKDSYLPARTLEIYEDLDLDLQQIQKINFFDYQTTFSDTVFSPEYYEKRGYLWKVRPENIEEVEDSPPDLDQNKKILFDYPFLSEKGDTIHLSKNDDSYLLLDFWFSSCEPCLKGLPKINSLANNFPSSRLQVVGINCFDLASYPYISSKLRAKGIKIELLYGQRKLVDSLKMNSFPTYLLISPNGKMQYLHGGAEDVIETINDLMKQ